MSVRPLFSVYDVKAKVYSNPFPALNAAVATRDFEVSCNDPNLQMNRFPEDFALFQIGEFDDVAGRCTYLETPISLGLAQQFKQ